MKLPRDISGRRVAQLLCRRWGYRLVHQVGSHMVLQTEDPSHHRLVVPDHTVLRLGTFHGILQSVARHKGVMREAIIEGL
jgi:predicted RNA binding protein YcfA (HicA-like mRNA interferase family)